MVWLLPAPSNPHAQTATEFPLKADLTKKLMSLSSKISS